MTTPTCSNSPSWMQRRRGCNAAVYHQWETRIYMLKLASMGKAAVDAAPAFINGCFLSFGQVRAPPGLEKSISDSETPVKIQTPALNFSLDALCIDAPNIPAEKINLLPPGSLDFRKLAGLAPPPGLSESEDSTTVRGASDADTSDSEETPSPKICRASLVGNGLMLSEVTELKATAPIFCPLLSSCVNWHIEESWQNWHMQNSLYDPSSDGWQSGEEYIRMAKDILDKDVDGWQSGEDWLRMARMKEDGEDSYGSAEIYSDHDCTDSFSMIEWQ